DGNHRRDDDGDTDGNDHGENGNDLRRILAAAEALFRSAYMLVSDRSQDRKMTHQRAQTLSDFASGAGKKGKDIAFRNFKNPSTLTTYFRKMKELLVYYYRVVYREDGHFTREEEDQVVPRDVIEPTDKQRQAMDEMFSALREEDEDREEGSGSGGGGDGGGDESESRLACAIRRFYVALICHSVGSVPFRSPVISFCAMLSRRKLKSKGGDDRNNRAGTGNDELDEAARRRKKLGGWADPGNYNSSLSALVWTAQLILFEAAYFYKRENEDQIPTLVERLCKKFMHQKEETVFGHILQWRLYLSAVAKSVIARNQARWSLDGQEIDYLGTKLHMKHISQLLVSEYKRARAILYDDLLFGANSIVPIEVWRMHDDLDAEDYGGSWLTDERNTELLRGTHNALLRQIEQRAEGRRRSILLWEKMVMVYVRYHKSQEQTGKETDNIRFMPPPIADLLLTFLAIVQPLRQTFLRQVKPGALLSPYLWSTLDGEVWRDELVSKCMSQACGRAQVPKFKVAWWRQVAASITKEKFTPKERANFNMEDIAAPEVVEEEEPMADLAVASNHSFRTFNHAYAGSTTLVMSTPLHRAYRASLSWRTLFQVEELL
ncbi:hypothetical protein BKA56DRAFT_449155, partial [Ilyonectria sp. MPI-CAGE-AT-0026]